MKMKHIDDVQTQTVDEHFKLFLEDKSEIDPEAIDVTSNDLPEWYNKELYKKAQNFYKQNMMSLTAASTIGLIVVFAVETILKVLLYTKRSSSTCSAFKRYTETMLHINNLFTQDPNDTDSKWYKSVNTIRWHHKVTTNKVKKTGIGKIYQKDMVLTQYGFVGFIYTAPKSFGLINTPEEDEAFNHFWRVTGYMIGIDDRFNLCRKNAKETTELCHKIKDLYATYLSKASSEFYDVIFYTLDALWYLDITIDKNSFMAFAYELHDLPYKKLGWYSWLTMKYRKWLFYLFLVPYIGIIFKKCTNFSTMFIIWSSQNFPALAWMKFGKNNVRLNPYPKH